MNSDEKQTRRLPSLREHDFRSSVPLIGPLIQWTRRILYQLTAKWAVWVVIQQQNQINRMVEEWLREQEALLREQEALLREQEALLIDMDKDLAVLARTVAEIETRQRYLLQRLRSGSGEDDLPTQDE